MNDATKGPWTYDETWALIKGPEGEEIAAIHCGQGDGARVNRNVALDNARLIAAAPELLEACENASAELKMMREVFGFSRGTVGTVSRSRWESAGDTMEALQVAIAKATGKEAA